ncbi:MAG: hypothetical protein HQK55_13310, partial [Deltaproteobacteria bacterium]|nr:hypothetical protein [Deltaproteobacteria bacterium]
MKKINFIILVLLCLMALPWAPATVTATPPVIGDYTAVPPFISAGSPPLVMLVMGRDESLYNAAYNNASDLDGDGQLETRFKPAIDYYGYFDSYKCYIYDSSSPRFEPTRATSDKTCGGEGEWSGNFLNYLTMSRMDCLRKVLYG